MLPILSESVSKKSEHLPHASRGPFQVRMLSTEGKLSFKRLRSGMNLNIYSEVRVCLVQVHSTALLTVQRDLPCSPGPRTCCRGTSHRSALRVPRASAVLTQLPPAAGLGHGRESACETVTAGSGHTTQQQDGAQGLLLRKEVRRQHRGGSEQCFMGRSPGRTELVLGAVPRRAHGCHLCNALPPLHNKRGRCVWHKIRFDLAVLF